MAIVKSKPTSPGSRFVVRVKNEGLYKGKPYAKLLARKNKTGGRNNQGRITSRHVGGGQKKRYRIMILKEINSIFQPLLNVLNMIQIERQILH